MITEAASPYLGKRRFEDREQDEYEVNFHPAIERTANREKARRLDDGGALPLRDFQSEHVRFLESQIVSLRVENQISQERKDNEIAQYQAYVQTMREQSQKIILEKNALLEENNLLKRAVQLLDKKQKDSSSHLVQLQQVLLQASEQISELERQNRNLSYHLSLLQRGPGFIDDQPPDVF